MSKTNSIVTIFFCLVFSVAQAGIGKLHLFNQYLADEKVTDFCVWKNHVWASTSNGIYEITDDGINEIQLPIRDNDRITSLYNGSPYTLICGTYQGDVIFLTQTQGTYCQAVWSLKEKQDSRSFYVNSVSKNNEGIWLGTLESGIYLYRPELDSLQNFSLDFNEEDSIGLNVYDVHQAHNSNAWVVAQDGLYFIMNIFGKNGELQYVKSRRVEHRPIALDFTENEAFIAYKKNHVPYMGKVRFGRAAFDVKINHKRRLPTDDIRAMSAKSTSDFWLLSDRLYHAVNDAWITYDLLDGNNDTIVARDMVMHKDHIWIRTAENGLIEYSLSPKEEPVQEETNDFNLATISYGQALELNMVFFSPGDSSLLERSFIQLTDLSDLLKTDTSVSVDLYGHTARDGQDKYLMSLSEARAKSVMNFLVGEGIDVARIRVHGMGSSQLKVPDNPKSPKNRRVEIVLSR